MDQVEKMNQDLVSSLTNENRDLKTDKRSLMQRLKMLMDKRTESRLPDSQAVTVKTSDGELDAATAAIRIAALIDENKTLKEKVG